MLERSKTFNAFWMEIRLFIALENYLNDFTVKK